jgi:hypothetical protein
MDEERTENPEPLYTVGRWKGLTQYRCTLCGWDTLHGEAAMREHMAQRHTPPPKPKRVSALLVNRFGNPIEVE